MSGYVDEVRYPLRFSWSVITSYSPSQREFRRSFIHVISAAFLRLSLRIMYSYLCVRSPFVLVINILVLQRPPRIPRRWNVIFAQGSPVGEFRIRVSPPAATSDPSRVFVTCRTHPQLFIAFMFVIHRLLLVVYAAVTHSRSYITYLHCHYKLIFKLCLFFVRFQRGNDNQFGYHCPFEI